MNQKIAEPYHEPIERNKANAAAQGCDHQLVILHPPSNCDPINLISTSVDTPLQQGCMTAENALSLTLKDNSDAAEPLVFISSLEDRKRSVVSLD